MSFE
jgi:hypothetical protein